MQGIPFLPKILTSHDNWYPQNQEWTVNHNSEINHYDSND